MTPSQITEIASRHATACFAEADRYSKAPDVKAAIVAGIEEFERERNKPSTSGRVNAIKEIARLCDEAIDHDTGWAEFYELCRRRLEIETALMPNRLRP